MQMALMVHKMMTANGKKDGRHRLVVAGLVPFGPEPDNFAPAAAPIRKSYRGPRKTVLGMLPEHR